MNLQKLQKLQQLQQLQELQELEKSITESQKILDSMTNNLHELKILFAVTVILFMVCFFLSSGAKAQYQRSSVTVRSSSYGSPVFINRGVVTTSPSASVNINSIRTFNRSSNINTFRGR